MSDTEEILYRENSNENFEKFVYIGTAYPEDMFNSPPRINSCDDLRELVEDDDFAEIIFKLGFILMNHYQSTEEFEDPSEEELYAFFEEKGGAIGNVVSNWLRSIEMPIFLGLDLKDQQIMESTYFDNGEHKEIIYTDGSEVKILNENGGYYSGYYVLEEKYPQLLEDIKELQEIIGGIA